MAYTPPTIDIDACEKAIQSCIETLVSEVCEEHIDQINRELSERLPKMAGRITARLMQEVPTGNIAPHFSINFLTTTTGETK